VVLFFAYSGASAKSVVGHRTVAHTVPLIFQLPGLLRRDIKKPPLASGVVLSKT
jgi:hypothetical protein